MRTLVNKYILTFSLAGAVLFSATPTLAYTVEKGDTMGNIAEDEGLSVKQLSELNPHISDINMIFVGDELDTEFNTKDESKTETVKEDTIEVNQVATADASVSEKDILAKLVEAEARDESYTGKVAVAEVILNRVDSGSFPDSIEGVIYQQGQFSPVNSGAINVQASQDSQKAVEDALNGSNLTGDALFFWNPAIAPNRWLESKQTVTTIGNHQFKK